MNRADFFDLVEEQKKQEFVDSVNDLVARDSLWLELGKVRKWSVKAGSAWLVLLLGATIFCRVPEAGATTVAQYQKAADAGDIQAMYHLGVVYYTGEGIGKKNYPKAREWFQKAADAGNSDAMFILGAMYDLSMGVARDYSQARQWYQKAVDAGNAEAMQSLGWIYENGDGVAHDYGKARDLYQKAADAGNAKAMNNLGTLYDGGYGVTQDYDKARDWYEKAADAGEAIAMSNLGLLYANGHGVDQDWNKARDWFQKGADADNADAMSNLGWLYEHGKGVTRSRDLAREWYQKAIAAGNTDAMNRLGALYATLRDYPKARAWYQKGAAVGDTDAMYNLARLYERGWGGAQDDARAREWYQKAADAGNTYAKQASLHLRKNTLTDQDPAQAAESNQLSKPYVGRWERITAAGLRESYEFTSDGRCSHEHPAASLQGTYVEEAPGILHLKVKGKVILGEDNGVFADTMLEYELKGSCLILTTETGSSDKFFPVAETKEGPAK